MEKRPKLDGEGQVRITDFGLAGLSEHVRDVRSGTPGYMAPEQKAGKEVAAHRDIYALGRLRRRVRPTACVRFGPWFASF